jgi:hypothetical protein
MKLESQFGSHFYFVQVRTTNMLAATRVALLALALTSSTFAVPDDGPAPLPPSECAGNVEEGNNKVRWPKATLLALPVLAVLLFFT